MIHANIYSSSNKYKYFIYYIDNLNITFSFIGLSETWASECNQDLLGITDYSHEQCIRSNNKKGEEQVYTFTIVFNIEEGVI